MERIRENALTNLGATKINNVKYLVILDYYHCISGIFTYYGDFYTTKMLYFKASKSLRKYWIKNKTALYNWFAPYRKVLFLQGYFCNDYAKFLLEDNLYQNFSLLVDVGDSIDSILALTKFINNAQIGFLQFENIFWSYGNQNYLEINILFEFISQNQFKESLLYYSISNFMVLRRNLSPIVRESREK